MFIEIFFLSSNPLCYLFISLHLTRRSKLKQLFYFHFKTHLLQWMSTFCLILKQWWVTFYHRRTKNSCVFCRGPHPQSSNGTHNGALHMGTKTTFTGSGSLIRIQCDLMHCPGALSLQLSTQFGTESRPCGGKVVFGSGSPICIRSRSKVPCGETQYSSILFFLFGAWWIACGPHAAIGCPPQF